MNVNVTTPISREDARKLNAGDIVSITGVIYTARDAAHKRMLEDRAAGRPFPFDIRDAVIYYCGPTPAAPGRVIGAAGPTTSYRMDAYAPTLIELGLTGMIGKGLRNDDVKNAMMSCGAVYFAAIGGAGALIAQSVKSAETIAYHDLGAEAVHRLYVENFPAIVVIDSHGNDLYSLRRG